jgi:hypothetical protein
MERTAVMRGTVATAMQDLQLALSGDTKYQVQTGPNDTVVIERFHRAGWVIWVCILLFPIGLFALLAPKRVDRGTVAVSDNGNGTVTLRIAGTFHGTSEAAVNGVIARGSSVQDGPTVDEIAEEIRKLDELRERGVLTSEEYEAQKKHLLP